MLLASPALHPAPTRHEPVPVSTEPDAVPMWCEAGDPPALVSQTNASESEPSKPNESGPAGIVNYKYSLGRSLIGGCLVGGAAGGVVGFFLPAPATTFGGAVLGCLGGTASAVGLNLLIVQGDPDHQEPG